MKTLYCALLTSLLFLPGSGFSKEIKGVTVPETVTLPDDSNLVLNGAGIRSKFFFNIYIGALYLTSSSNDIQHVLNDTGPKRVTMHILYDDLARKKITSAWTEGFEENNSPEQFNALKARLEAFNASFTDLKKGDTVTMDYLPGTGTRVSINNDVKATIEGHDFNTALLKVWLGESPADSSLKRAMMGQ